MATLYIVPYLWYTAHMKKPTKQLVKSETIWNSNNRSTFLYMHIESDGNFHISSRRLTEDRKPVASCYDSDEAWNIYNKKADELRMATGKHWN